MHVSSTRRRASVVVLASTFIALLTMVLPAAATSAPPGCKNRTNNTYAKLLDCVTVEGVRAHQAAFQRIANANGDEFYPGTRAAGTEGYQGSVDYVSDLLRAAGYQVTLDGFEFEFEFEFPVVLDQLTPVEAKASFDASAATNTGFGDVTETVVPVDINLAPPRANDSGCSTTTAIPPCPKMTSSASRTGRSPSFSAGRALSQRRRRMRRRPALPQ